MLRNIEGTIVYQRHDKNIIVDRINSEIIAHRMINAGFCDTFADFIAYGGGIKSTQDAIELGKRCGKVAAMLTPESHTIHDKIIATQQRIDEEIQKYLDRK